MFKVKNKKTIYRLSDKNFRAGKIRNSIAVIAIILTSVLFTALFTIASGMVENIQRQTMRQAGGDGMAVLKYITEEEYQNMKTHPLIKEISYNRMICDEIKNEELLKRHGELYYMDDVGIKLGFCEPVEGRKPEAANEIMTDLKTLQLLNIEPEIGATVQLTMMVHGKEVTRDFVLSGWWEADPVFNISMMVTSRAYVEEHIDELYNSYKSDYSLTGVINSYIMFWDTIGLSEKLDRVITERGYSRNSEAPNYIEANTNWSYMSATIDAGTAFAILGVALLIILTGYLIIYNIFQISVIRDIRFYGLLKTIGTTGAQIKSIIRRQVMWLLLMGIPAGLILGYVIGCKLVPVIMSSTSYRGNYEITPSPIIFLGSTLFAIFTVIVSTAKPQRIAAKVSPIEAVRYTDNSNIKNRRNAGRERRKGANIQRMAAANLGRNRKRTALVLLSISLSLVVFNSIYTVSIGFDMDKFLSKFVDMDFLVAHADYFNHRYGGPHNAVSEEFIEAVKEQPGFLEGGRYYCNSMGTPEIFKAEEPKNYVPIMGLDNRDSAGYIFTDVIGVEDELLQQLDVLEGEIDIEKLKSGEYILEGVRMDDNGKQIEGSSNYQIGDTVVLHNYRGTGELMEENEFCTWEYKVMAKVAIRTYTNSTGRFIGFSNFYIPAEIYKKMVAVPGVMNYSFNVKDGMEEEMEEFLKNYTENVDPMMGYRSKDLYVKEFENLQSIVLIVGGALSFVIGMIGILNFINSMLTSIFTRRREFAMLQSIGLTKRQLCAMLMLEGLYYTMGAGALSVLLAAVLSVGVLKGMIGGMWFCTYQFTVIPLLVVLPILLLIGVWLPYMIIKVVEKQSIVERLRECE